MNLVDNYRQIIENKETNAVGLKEKNNGQKLKKNSIYCIHVCPPEVRPKLRNVGSTSRCGREKKEAERKKELYKTW